MRVNIINALASSVPCGSLVNEYLRDLTLLYFIEDIYY